MSDTYPTSPFDVCHEVDLVELAERYTDHRFCVYRHRYDVAPLPAGEFAEHCLGALVYQAVLADRASAGRWVYAVDALAAGATDEQVASAMGIATCEGLHAGLAGWAEGQPRAGLMTAARYVEVLELIGQVPA